MAGHIRKKPVDENLILRVRVIFLKSKLTMTAFATIAGCSRSLVWTWFELRGEPQREHLERISARFKVSMDKLTGQNLTPEQREAELRDLRRIVDVDGGLYLQDVLDAFEPSELVRILEAHLPSGWESENAKPRPDRDGKASASKSFPDSKE